MKEVMNYETQETLSGDSGLGGRRFYDIPKSISGEEDEEKMVKIPADVNVNGKEELLRYISSNVIGNEATFSGPFGRRRIVYADYTASGRALSFMERYIYQEILPYYGNTHTTSTVTSLQSTLFRHEARDVVRNAVNASEHDAVIFVSSGSTGAVHKLVNAISGARISGDDKETVAPIVIAGPWEHHSNLLPWREVASRVFQMDEDDGGNVDMKQLKSVLEEVDAIRVKGQKVIGCFTAASNVTGVKADVDSISILLHRHNCLSFFDYATAAPHSSIDMNPLSSDPLDQPFIHKDAVFISPHKFVGGVNTPGILIAKKNLFHATPSEGGGGSVFFVTEQGHRYLQEVEMREEAGTPDIVGSIRAGLVFQLKNAVGTKLIEEREGQLARKALDAWQDVSGLYVLGPTDKDRLPVFSLMFSASGSGLFLHHNYVSALLNDLFGIQSRGGCACAGPYAQKLMGIDLQLANRFEEMLLEDQRLDRTHLRRYREYSQNEILRPGFVRLNLSFFAGDEEIEFLIEAVKWIAANAASLLPLYLFNRETGEWSHKDHQVFRDRRWLGNISYQSGEMTWRNPIVDDKGPLPSSFSTCFFFADELLASAVSQMNRRDLKLGDQSLLFSGEAASLRWFLLPSEALSMGKNGEKMEQKAQSPFFPVRYRRADDERKPEGESCLKQEEKSGFSELEAVVTEEESGYSTLGTIESERLNDGADNLNLKNGDDLDFVSDDPSLNHSSCYLSTLSLVTPSPTESLIASSPTKPSGTPSSTESSDAPSPIGSSPAKSSPNESSVISLSGTQNPLDKPITSIPLYFSKSKKQKGKEQTQPGRHNSVASKEQKSKKSSVRGKTRSSTTDPIAKEPTAENDNGIPEQKSDGNSAPIASCPTGTCPRLISFNSRRRKTDVSLVGEAKWFSPGRKLYKPTAEAIETFDMIEDGDRVLVCLSGGKDSLSLLHTLRQYQFAAKSRGVSFQFGALTVDPLSASYDPSPLIPYLKGLGVPYFYEEQDILGQAAAANPESICAFCSRMKRGRIYSAARREGYNVLAFGQHLDDLAESFLMSVFHNGLLRTMKANYRVNEGDLRLIRPFVFVREKHTRDFAEKNKLPVIPENCPACFEAPKERHRFKQLLASQELLFPDVYSHLLKAMLPLISVKTNVANEFVAHISPDEEANIS